jgi:hypothetical protein
MTVVPRVMAPVFQTFEHNLDAAPDSSGALFFATLEQI